MYAVEFDKVTKCFDVRLEGPLTFHTIITNLGRLRRRHRRHKHWILRDVSFGVRSGEMLGIVGVNGSGKSTTLKLISRIIEPTSGSVRVNGRVSALLELGAGFHPDLTGRENIYLNGSIMGLSRKEIERKFDDIVRFAELESAIDIPTRFYSSGMYMRLGFAVAIHAEPEILLVDEVLAVGDYGFQTKCLRSVGDLRRRGTTILFVSHDMDKVREFCDRAIWLDGGGVCADGDPDWVVAQYLRGVSDGELDQLRQGKKLVRGQRWGSGEIEFIDVRFLGPDGMEKSCFVTGEPVCVRMRYVARKRIRRPVFGMALYASDGTWITGSNTYSSGCDVDWVDGEGQITYVIDSLPFLEGNYLYSATVYDYDGEVHQAYDHLDKAFLLQVRSHDEIKESLGFIHMPSQWAHERFTVS